MSRIRESVTTESDRRRASWSSSLNDGIALAKRNELATGIHIVTNKANPKRVIHLQPACPWRHPNQLRLAYDPVEYSDRLNPVHYHRLSKHITMRSR